MYPRGQAERVSLYSLVYFFATSSMVGIRFERKNHLAFSTLQTGGCYGQSIRYFNHTGRVYASHY